MKLYEIALGRWMGESYLRVYVWAESEEQAYDMAGLEFDKAGYPDHIPLVLRELFSASSPAFCTDPSDKGWEKK